MHLLDRKPNWQKWKLMPEANVWQAVALSLNIEPDKVRQERSLGRRKFEEGELFDDRLTITCSNLFTQNGLKIKAITVPDRTLISIDLAKFAAWSMKVGWQIPTELEDLAEKASLDRSTATDALHPKAERSLFKMILAMAMDKYRYNPDEAKSSAPGRIASAVEQHGMKLDQDTVRSWLHKAAEATAEERRSK